MESLIHAVFILLSVVKFTVSVDRVDSDTFQMLDENDKIA
jgi:hypothetical protein